MGVVGGGGSSQCGVPSPGCHITCTNNESARGLTSRSLVFSRVVLCCKLAAI